jgi:hypothetical protein
MEILNIPACVANDYGFSRRASYLWPSEERPIAAVKPGWTKRDLSFEDFSPFCVAV